MKLNVALSFLPLIFVYNQLSYASVQKNKEPSFSLQEHIDNYLKENKDKEQMTAVALTLQCEGFHNNTPNSYFAGTLTKDSSKHVNKNSIFQIGSLTKSFVATTLLLIEDDPKYKNKNFSLDDKIENWLPEYDKWKDIKIKQLLSMTSGISDYFEISSFLKQYTSDPFKNISKKDILKYLKDTPLKFTPGNQYEYSNTNYILAGLIIEKITENDANAEITQRIINKLNLKNTYFPKHEPSTELTENLVHGYSTRPRNLFTQVEDTINFSLSTASTAGGIISTTEEINLYINALFKPGMLLTEAQLKKLLSIPNLKDPSTQSNYGLGVNILKTIIGETFYSHGGTTEGHRAFYVYYPTSGNKTPKSIVLTINSTSYSDSHITFLNEALKKIEENRICN